MRHKGRQDARSAFTIVELLVVITLMALIAGAVGGAYSRPYKNMLTKKAARELLLAAKYARMAAIEQQKVCYLVIDAANKQVRVRVEETDQTSGTTTASDVKNQYWRTVSLQGDVRFEVVMIDKTDEEEISFAAAGEEVVRFRPDGTAEAALIQVGDGNRHYVVTISAMTGRAVVTEGVAEDFGQDTIDLDEKSYD